MKKTSYMLRCMVILLFVCLARSHGSKSFVMAGSRCEERAQVSGIRLEAVDPNYQKTIGYLEEGVSTVQAGIEMRVVLFGKSLDKVCGIGFSSKLDCSEFLPDASISQFFIQKDEIIVLKYAFPESEAGTEWSVCVEQCCDGKSKFVPIRDPHSKISTHVPKRSYYLVWLPLQIGVIIVLLVFSGLFSGLNLGLMALTPQELTLISKSGSEQEKYYAETILPVRKKGNLLLCSLLIGNVLVNSAISILFDDLTSGHIALILSSFGIVVFGEIFPQALCVKKGLAVGAHTINITRFFMVLTWPLAFPISLILNCILGGPVASYDRKRIMELIKLSTRNGEGLADELKIAVGAMEISDKTVAHVMTKADDVYMLADNTVLNTAKISEILRTGYTRIPVYSENRDNIVALLFVKDLALLDPDDNFTVKMVCSYHGHLLRFVTKETPLRDMLEEFKKGDYHMAIVEEEVAQTDDPKNPIRELVGVVTLEDILEEILQAEILDETDAILDNVHRTRRFRPVNDNEVSNEMLNTDTGAFLISLQMQMVTVQWLSTNHSAFGREFINHTTLENVLRQHVHKVELSHLVDYMNSSKTTVCPRSSKLYVKDEQSNRFVLILEGRALVTIGEGNMTFEAGPWHCFGSELLDDLVQLIRSKNLSNKGSRGDLPKISAAESVSSFFVINQQLETEGKNVSFIPDFTATIRDECTYLEIDVPTYLLAFKTTHLSRQRKGGVNEFAPDRRRVIRDFVKPPSSNRISRDNSLSKSHSQRNKSRRNDSASESSKLAENQKVLAEDIIESITKRSKE